MADLDVLTRKAVLGSRWRFIDFDERADVARFAIVEYLLTATEPPGFWELVNAGERTIRQRVEAEKHWGGFYLTRAGVESYAVAGWDPLVELSFWLGTSDGLGVLLLIAITSVAVITFLARQGRLVRAEPWLLVCARPRRSCW